MMGPEMLISRYFQDLESMTQPELDQLSEWIKQDRAHAKLFAQAAFAHRAIYDSLMSEQTQEALTAPQSSPSSDDFGFGWDDRFWHWIAEYEKTAPAMEIAKPDLGRKETPKAEPARSAPQGSRVFLLVSVVGLVAIALLCVVGEIERRWFPSEVATLRSSMQTRWTDSAGPELGDRLTCREEPFRLASGMVDVVFDSGAEAVIEGPAQFRLKSAGRMELQSGCLFANVDQSARGFTVDTPYGRVVDLGTQFGVKVDSNSSSDLHLFKGKASLMPTGAYRSEIITAGKAGSVNAMGRVRSIPVDDTAFVRRFFPRSGFTWRGQPIDLADVVGGGNGFGTGRLNRWLEVNTGLDGTRFIVDGKAAQRNQATDNRYHRVTHLPYVDGVFSPDANAGPVQVSSENHCWQDCPKTGGMFFEDIFNGDYISFGTDSHGLILKGQAYGTREHPAIALHSNVGITFDLDALRRDMPGLEIVRFRGRCGVTEAVRTHLSDGTSWGIADFWVLVDGKNRFEARGMTVDAEPSEISVPLNGRDRFVTLVTTDGGAGANFDWGFFAEPRLELQVVQ
jgi:hypothetical protein